MVSRSHDTPLDFDLELAVQQSSKNPVYYVQYAHARICSILRTLERAAGAASRREARRRSRSEEHERALRARRWRASRSSCARPPSSAPRTASTPTSASWRPSSTCSTGTAACSSTTRRVGLPHGALPGHAADPRRAGSTCSGSRRRSDVRRGGRQALGAAPGRRRHVPRGPRQAAKRSWAQPRSSSICSGVSSRSSPSRCETATLYWPRSSRSTTLSSTMCATSRPGIAGV